jgi:hypothetical protein
MIPDLIDQKERDDAPVVIVLPAWIVTNHDYAPFAPREMNCPIVPRVSASVSRGLASIFASVGVNDGDWYLQGTLEQCKDAALPLLVKKLESALVVLREMIRVNELKKS